MRDPERIDRILGKLKTHWEEHPDMRLGQLLSNISPDFEQNPFYTEDDELEKEMDSYLYGTG
jgi:hypothetical protein